MKFSQSSSYPLNFLSWHFYQETHLVEMTSQKSRACVTGASGYIGSWLVKKLPGNGFTVPATLRNLEDESKVGILKSLQNAESKLVLFQVDIYNPLDFDPTIKGCEFVFHVATPMQHNIHSNQAYCRVMHSITNRQAADLHCKCHGIIASHRGGNGPWSRVDESCWTPLDHPFSCATDFTMEHTRSKTLAEKAVLRYNEVENGKLEVVTLPFGVVGGDTLLPCLPLSLQGIFSQLNGNSNLYNALKFVQEITGSVPLVHIEDVCRAPIFCMGRPSMRGRFLCAVANPTLKGIGLYLQENFPAYRIAKE